MLGWGPTTNTNVTPLLAGYSWDYLSYLILYCIISIMVPIFSLIKFIPHDELLYPKKKKKEGEEEKMPEIMEMGMPSYGMATMLENMEAMPGYGMMMNPYQIGMDGGSDSDEDGNHHQVIQHVYPMHPPNYNMRHRDEDQRHEEYVVHPIHDSGEDEQHYVYPFEPEENNHHFQQHSDEVRHEGRPVYPVRIARHSREDSHEGHEVIPTYILHGGKLRRRNRK